MLERKLFQPRRYPLTKLPEIVVPSAEKYFDVIREAGIVLDKEERKASILEQVNQAATLVGGEAIIEEGLLNEVTNLVEMPTAVMGGFDRESLSLPRRHTCPRLPHGPAGLW